MHECSKLFSLFLVFFSYCSCCFSESAKNKIRSQGPAGLNMSAFLDVRKNFCYFHLQRQVVAFFFSFQRYFCKNAQKPQLFCMCMLIALLLVSPLHNMRCNYTRNPAILLESSVSIKLLLWARNYCSIPKWQPQKYRKSYKGNCKANHLENKCRIGSQHAAHHIPKALEKMSN